MKYTLIHLILCFSLFYTSCDTIAQKNAGIISYFKSGDTIYVLLADHTKEDRGWASFGGTHIAGESNEQTAIREFHEETKNLFQDQNISEKIKKSPRIEQKTFVSFVVEVDFVPVHKIMNTPIRGIHYNERGNYAWVPLSEIFRAINTAKNGEFYLKKIYLPKNAPNNKLYKPFVKVMQQAQTNKIFDIL